MISIEALYNSLNAIGIHNAKITKNKYTGKPVVVYSKEKTENESRVNMWGKVFDLYYEKILSNNNSQTDTSVWKSSYTNEIIPANEINDWVNGFVSKLDSFLTKDTKILEIGCGNGLILNKLISKVKSYTAIDCSYYAIESLKKSSIFKRNKNKIKLHNYDASEIFKLDEIYDIVIINSVIQYFPSIEYFLNILSSLEKNLNTTSLIAIGDIRSFLFSNLHYYEMAICKNKNNEELKDKINYFQCKDKETFYSPIFFKKLNLMYDWITSASVTIKSSKYLNEMTKYRYDAMIFCDKNHQNDYDPSNIPQNIDHDTLTSEIDLIKIIHVNLVQCWNIHNPFLNDLFLKYFEEIDNSKYKINHSANTLKTNELIKLYDNLLSNNLFFDLFEVQDTNCLYFFAANNPRALAFSYPKTNFNIFNFSNNVTTHSSISLGEFFINYQRENYFTDDSLEGYHILDIPSKLLLLV